MLVNHIQYKASNQDEYDAVVIHLFRNGYKFHGHSSSLLEVKNENWDYRCFPYLNIKPVKKYLSGSPRIGNSDLFIQNDPTYLFDILGIPLTIKTESGNVLCLK